MIALAVGGGVLLAGALIAVNEFVLDNGFRRLNRAWKAQDRAFEALARDEES